MTVLIGMVTLALSTMPFGLMIFVGLYFLFRPKRHPPPG